MVNAKIARLVHKSLRSYDLPQCIAVDESRVDSEGVLHVAMSYKHDKIALDMILPFDFPMTPPMFKVASYTNAQLAAQVLHAAICVTADGNWAPAMFVAPTLLMVYVGI